MKKRTYVRKSSERSSHALLALLTREVGKGSGAPGSETRDYSPNCAPTSSANVAPLRSTTTLSAGVLGNALT